MRADAQNQLTPSEQLSPHEMFANRHVCKRQACARKVARGFTRYQDEGYKECMLCYEEGRLLLCKNSSSTADGCPWAFCVGCASYQDKGQEM